MLTALMEHGSTNKKADKHWHIHSMNFSNSNKTIIISEELNNVDNT
jgi:hypothetical protein